MRPLTYRLENRVPVPSETPGHTHIGRTVIGPMTVSTVFLGIDHNFGDGPPALFETMIFGSAALGDWQERAATWDDAEAIHRRAVDLCRGSIDLG